MPATARSLVTPPDQGREAPRAKDQHPGEPTHPGVSLAPPGIVPESDVRVHTPAAAAPQREHGHVNEGLGELPWAYGDGRLVGLVRDPVTLFIYWDFAAETVRIGPSCRQTAGEPGAASPAWSASSAARRASAAPRVAGAQPESSRESQAARGSRGSSSSSWVSACQPGPTRIVHGGARPSLVSHQQPPDEATRREKGA